MKKITSVILILFSSLQLFGQDLNKPRLDTINANGVSYVGKVVKGNYDGLWTGTDVLSDSISSYARFEHGLLVESYFVHPLRGPILLNQVSNTRDTLSQLIYERNGELLFKTKLYVSDTSSWRRNVFTPGTTLGESGMKLVQRLEYYYDFDSIPGFTLIQENNYGADNYAHYYLKGQFICTVNAKGKVIRGDEKRYRKIIAK